MPNSMDRHEFQSLTQEFRPGLELGLGPKMFIHLAPDIIELQHPTSLCRLFLKPWAQMQVLPATAGIRAKVQKNFSRTARVPH